jgi:opacity protein-like surface antigen
LILTRGLRAGVLPVLLLAGLALAQNAPEHRWTANFGAGFTPLTGQIGQKLDNGWHITVGGGYNVTPRFSAGLQFMYNGVGVSDGVLAEAQVPAGNAHIWSITAEPRIRLAPSSMFDPYFIGGVGYYRRVVQFTQPTVAPALIFDPFFGFYQGFVPADVVLGTITRGGLGGSAGLGFQFHVGSSGAKIFTEARYHYANTGGVPIRMVPVTFGIRW